MTPRPRHGCVVFFTGLPASGKTTVSTALARLLREVDVSSIELLDGDSLRKVWSPPLGFSKADRDRQVASVAELARDVALRGGIAICAVIAPYDEARRQARRLVEGAAEFVLVHVSTPLAVCQLRDPKGLYQLARDGLLQGLTGVSDPYESPDDADVTVDTSVVSPEQAAAQIVAELMARRVLGDRRRV